mmetsp:Transcript_20411/g.62061  ORF Transcript_20411/g.62061 Transcript_20411/m.62061 type:complete len:205 (-) Transcript_20411:4088-4702(-)
MSHGAMPAPTLAAMSKSVDVMVIMWRPRRPCFARAVASRWALPYAWASMRTECVDGGCASNSASASSTVRGCAPMRKVSPEEIAEPRMCALDMCTIGMKRCRHWSGRMSRSMPVSAYRAISSCPGGKMTSTGRSRMSAFSRKTVRCGPSSSASTVIASSRLSKVSSRGGMHGGVSWPRCSSTFALALDRFSLLSSEPSRPFMGE